MGYVSGRREARPLTSFAVTLLAVETSCDETSAAVLDGDYRVRASVVASQADLHARYGGVVPEVAARRQLEVLPAAVEAALADAGVRPEDLDALAVTAGPGLIGPLLVGVHFARGLARRLRRPLTPVNHLEGHIWAARLEDPALEGGFVAAVVSGGHTLFVDVEAPGRYRVMGRSIDDAAGEAFDKVSVLLGLGYPGGPAVDRAAEGADPGGLRFPRGRVEGRPFDTSFAGLKTAVLYHLRDRFGGDPALGTVHPPPPEAVGPIAAAFQEAVVEAVVERAVAAADAAARSTVVLSGGVAANRRLRERLGAAAAARGLRFIVPRLAWCTDNAAMIGAAALARGLPAPPEVAARARWPLDDPA